MIKKHMKKGNLFVAITLLIAFILTSVNLNFADEVKKYDIVVKNGTIMNPETEHELKGYNLAIKDGTVVRITKEQLTGEREIDATGMIVSPGFIDLITYEPNDVGVIYKIHDGVTSNLLMHGGTENAKKWYDYWNRVGRKINYGASSFITRHRWSIIGYSIDKSITNEEDIQRLVREVRENIEEGALGISFSFEYVPGIKSNEVIPLLELANEVKAPTFYHLRYSDPDEPGTSLEGIQEVIDYAEETGAAIHIMHINSTGGTFVMEEALDMVHDAIDKGLDISTCLYPYDFWATYLNSARFRPGWQERYRITYNDLQIGGSKERLTKETFNKYKTQRILVAAHGSMPEEEIKMALKDPIVMVGSDTIIEPSGNNHPRGAGNYARLFGKYVREEKVITMMEAIKKASLMPAQRLESIAPSMKRKGRIEIGADADLTIFNPDTIIDKSTVENPATASQGIEYVIVNGVLVKDENGIVKNANPGQPIQSYFIDKSTENTPIEYKISLDEQSPQTLENVYNIDGNKYLPITGLMKTIGQPITEDKNGQIKIGDSIELQIGSDVGYINGEEIQLTNEPIIYKGQIYINSNDLPQILGDLYSVNIVENKIDLITLEKVKEDEDTTIDNGKEDKDSETDNDTNDNADNEETEKKSSALTIAIIPIVFIGLISFLIYKKKLRK